MIETKIIYVELLDEGTTVWRPVKAERIRDDVYLIVDQRYDRDDEMWQFEPGDEVLCKQIESSDGLILVAISKV